MRTQPLILGIALGCVALAATALITQRRTARASTDVPPPDLPSAPARAADPLVAASLAAPPEILLDDGAAQTTTRAATPREQVDEQASTSTSGLLALLEEAHALGLVSDGRMAEFLAQIYLENGQGRRALRLLEQNGCTDVNAWASVAEVLAQAGDIAGQKEALLAALAVEPGNDGLLESLGSIEPGLVVTELARMLAAQPPPGDGNLRARLANALLQNGQGSEARALVNGLLLENPEDQQAIMLLAAIDPQHAIDHVQSQLARSSDPEELRALLVGLLTDEGNAAGAEAALERFAREGQNVGAQEWGRIAQYWLETQQTARGVSALQRALVHEHGDPDEWVHQLEGLAPADLMLALERRVSGDEARNDEYWGSLADSYWQAGRASDARAAWERARALDPDDGEWPGRLKALDQGQDPFNN